MFNQIDKNKTRDNLTEEVMKFQNFRKRKLDLKLALLK